MTHQLTAQGKKLMAVQLGVAHLLISPEALHQRQFDRAYFN